MDELNKEKIGIVILAAGESQRFGSPKQLAVFEGKTLIERAADRAISTGFETFVVLGANAPVIHEVIKDFRCEFCVNEDWENGMSSSIKVGLTKLLKKNPHLSAVILTLCDQPFITKETLLQLAKTYRECEKRVVASKYENTVGTPALFAKELFPELLKLEGDKGAKLLIQKQKKTHLAFVRTPEAALDIDTKKNLLEL